MLLHRILRVKIPNSYEANQHFPQSHAKIQKLKIYNNFLKIIL